MGKSLLAFFNLIVQLLLKWVYFVNNFSASLFCKDTLPLYIFCRGRIGARDELCSTARCAESRIRGEMTYRIVNCTRFLRLRRAHELLLLLFYLDDLVRLCIVFRGRFLCDLLTVELHKVGLGGTLTKVLGIVGDVHTRLIKHNIERLLNVLLQTQIFQAIFILFRNRVVMF